MTKIVWSIAVLLLLGICLTACSDNDRPPVEPGDVFRDIPNDYYAGEEIDTEYRADIMEACRTDPLMFCPDAPRQEAAGILLKALAGSEYLPLDAAGLLDDVPVENRYSRWIEEAVNRDIISSCSDRLFCPNAPVNQAQICVFLIKTIEDSSFLPPQAIGLFSDVPAANP